MTSNLSKYVIFCGFLLAFSVCQDCISKSELEALVAFQANEISSDRHIFISSTNKKFLFDLKELERAAEEYTENIHIHHYCMITPNSNKAPKNFLDIDELAIEYRNNNEYQVDIVSKGKIKRYNIPETFNFRKLFTFICSADTDLLNNVNFQSKSLMLPYII